LDEFNFILGKVKGYTNYIYLHVLGEPFANPNINGYIISAKDNGIKVNLTTNGTLLKEKQDILSNKYLDNIHQINISLHCEFENIMGFDDYFDNIAYFSKIASEGAYINLRLWGDGEGKAIIEKLNRIFSTNIDSGGFKRNKAITLQKNIFLHWDRKFVWPELGGEEIFTGGKCYALKDQIAILSNGVVTPCCLDADGNMALGDIFKENMCDILNSERALNIVKNFSARKVAEKFCKTCGFALRNNSL
jgi:radical SAM protein with 4Fe4S-binding SPASM domain